MRALFDASSTHIVIRSTVKQEKLQPLQLTLFYQGETEPIGMIDV